MADQDAEIRALAQSGNKIEAIRRYRERTGVGLKEAKDFVDALAAGENPTVAAPMAIPPGSPSGHPAIGPEIDALLIGGQKIQAVKLVRERTGLGLKESKDLVDARERELAAEGRMAAKSGCFIATAVYGSEYAPEVAALRGFRDVVLTQSDGGRRFIGWYYRWSPPFATRLAHHPWLCKLVRASLRPLVAFCRSRKY